MNGPNVMLGYIRPDAPGKIVPPQDGWYDTGDVVASTKTASSPSAAGCKRFAKIGGETVSLAVVENIAAALWPDNAPCRRRGAGSRARASRSCWRPMSPTPAVSTWWPGRRIMASPNWRCRGGSWLWRRLPVLGTGKTDYVTVQKLVAAADERADAAGQN